MLAKKFDWDKMESELKNLYSEQGKLCIPIRKIACLLLLKEMFKENDETVVDGRIKNPNWQYLRVIIFFKTRHLLPYVIPIIYFK